MILMLSKWIILNVYNLTDNDNNIVIKSESRDNVFNFKRKYYNTTYIIISMDVLVNKFVDKYSYFQSKYDNNILYLSYTLQLSITNKYTIFQIIFAKGGESY